MRLKEKFPFYFLGVTAVYLVVFVFSLTTLIGPGITFGIYEYPEFWVFAIIPFLPLFSLFAYINSKNPENSRWRLISIILVSIAIIEFIFIILPLV